MYLVKSAVKKLVSSHNKRISADAMAELDRKVENIILSAIRLCNHHKTIKATEVRYARG